MKPLKIMVVVLCLILIGLLPKDSGHNTQPPIPSIVSQAVSANTAFLPGAPKGSSGDEASPLALGEETFIKYCSDCHSSEFVWQSKILAGEADSVVKKMLSKDQKTIDSEHHKLLLDYLSSRLPKN